MSKQLLTYNSPNKQAISRLQRLLGFPEEKIDGIFGPKTESTLKAFQEQNNLKVDGKIIVDGGETWLKLLEINNNNQIIDNVESEKRTLSEQGTNSLKKLEALRLKPYDDQTSKRITEWIKGATIGYGHLIKKREWNSYKNGITNDRAKELFRTDLQPYEKAVNDKIKVPFTQNQFDAAVIFTFNIGIRGFARSSALRLINDPQAQTPYPTLEEAWKAFNKSQGKINRGLVSRRDAEWNIYTKGIYKKTTIPTPVANSSIDLPKLKTELKNKIKEELIKELKTELKKELKEEIKIELKKELKRDIKKAFQKL